MSAQNGEKLTPSPLIRANTPSISKNSKFLYQKMRTSASEEELSLSNVRTGQTSLCPNCGRLFGRP